MFYIPTLQLVLPSLPPLGRKGDGIYIQNCITLFLVELHEVPLPIYNVRRETVHSWKRMFYNSTVEYFYYKSSDEN